MEIGGLLTGVNSLTAGTNDFVILGAVDISGAFTPILFLYSAGGTSDFFEAGTVSATVRPANGVPEPATLGLLGLALAGIAARRRNRN